MTHRWFAGLLVIPLVLASSGRAIGCLWDTDTIAAERAEVEKKGAMGLIEALTGRFERNPPLYYEMRLKRVAPLVESDPQNWSAYDDAGVACDRLGRQDEAMDWMKKKRKALEAAGVKPAGMDWYRYHANLGTFLMHRWVKAGGDRSKMDEVRAARDEIARAIEINPDAHFGRETVQLAAMDSILNAKETPSKTGTLPSLVPGLNPTEAVKGLSGLIRLGNAWESVDVYNSLSEELQRSGEYTYLATWAKWRAEELLAAGKSTLFPGYSGPQGRKIYLNEPDLMVQDPTVHRSLYQKHRQAADRYHEARTAYMMSRLEAGRHPDTDSTFWDAFQHEPIPELPKTIQEIPSAEPPSAPTNWLALTNRIVQIAFLTMVATTSFLWVWRSRIKRPVP